MKKRFPEEENYSMKSNVLALLGFVYVSVFFICFVGFGWTRDFLGLGLLWLILADIFVSSFVVIFVWIVTEFFTGFVSSLSRLEGGEHKHDDGTEFLTFLSVARTSALISIPLILILGVTFLIILDSQF